MIYSILYVITLKSPCIKAWSLLVICKRSFFPDGTRQENLFNLDLVHYYSQDFECLLYQISLNKAREISTKSPLLTQFNIINGFIFELLRDSKEFLMHLRYTLIYIFGSKASHLKGNHLQNWYLFYFKIIVSYALKLSLNKASVRA